MEQIRRGDPRLTFNGDSEDETHTRGTLRWYLHDEGTIGIGRTLRGLAEFRILRPNSYRDGSIGREATGDDLDLGPRWAAGG